jgi:hypothetical protein
MDGYVDSWRDLDGWTACGGKGVPGKSRYVVSRDRVILKTLQPKRPECYSVSKLLELRKFRHAHHEIDASEPTIGEGKKKEAAT